MIAKLKLWLTDDEYRTVMSALNAVEVASVKGTASNAHADGSAVADTVRRDVETLNQEE